MWDGRISPRMQEGSKEHLRLRVFGLQSVLFAYQDRYDELREWVRKQPEVNKAFKEYKQRTTP